MKKPSFTPFPIIKTDQLTLRQLRTEDAHEIFALHSDKKNTRYIDRPLAKSPEDSFKFINMINAGIARDEWILWAITLKDQHRLIGTICLWHFSEDFRRAELGFELNPAYQGKGIMRQSLAKVIDYGFYTLNLEVIKAYTNTENVRSIKLLETYKFVCDGIQQDKYTATEEYYDTGIYVLKNPALQA